MMRWAAMAGRRSLIPARAANTPASLYVGGRRLDLDGWQGLLQGQHLNGALWYSL